MKLRVIADGSVTGTRVIDVDTGRNVSGVKGVQFRHMAGGLPEIEIELLDVVIDAVPGRARFYIHGVGFVRAAELEDGSRVELPQLEQPAARGTK